MNLTFRRKPLQEITLRKFEKPKEVDIKEALTLFSMSIGLLQPGDSRNIIVDILELFLLAKKDKKILTVNDLIESLKNKKGATPSNIRRHLRRMKELGLIEEWGSGYRIREWMNIKEFINEYLEPFFIKPIIERIKEYGEFIDKSL